MRSVFNIFSDSGSKPKQVQVIQDTVGGELLQLSLEELRKSQAPSYALDDKGKVIALNLSGAWLTDIPHTV